MREFTALYLANGREFVRDKMATIIVLLLPVALAVFFGLIFGGGDGEAWTLHLAVVNEDEGPAGAQLLAGLQTPELEEAVRVNSGTRAEMMELLNEGETSVVLVLPAELSASLGQGSSVEVEALYDPAQAATSGAALGMVQTMLSEANLALSGAPQLLEMKAVRVQAEGEGTVDVYMPGMLGVALLWLGLFGTALPLMQQRKGQVLRRLSVTPLRPAAMLGANIAWRVTVGLMQAALFVLVGWLAFGVGVQGNMLLFAGTVALGALVFVSMGYVLAGVSSSEEMMMAVTQIINIPLMMVSGGLFPLEYLPAFFKPLVVVSPLTYLTDALGQLMVGAPAVNPLWLDYAVLGGWLVVLLVLGVKFWRWE